MPPPYSKTNLYSNCTQSPKKNLESLDFSRFLGSFFLFELNNGHCVLRSNCYFALLYIAYVLIFPLIPFICIFS